MISMSLQRQEDTAPPPLEEGYWKALLTEGEYAAAAFQAAHDGEARNGRGLAHHHEAYNHEDVTTSLQPYPDTRSNTDRDWEELARLMSADETILLPVVSYNRGGLLVEWRSLRGFVPASQLLNFPSTSNSAVRRSALARYVGHTLRLRIIELNAEQNRLILSERAAQVAAGERAQLLSHLAPGDCVTGHVTNLCNFGAFIDLGGLEGLIHISELSWGRVSHPADMLKRGQEVKAYVLNVDRENGRIALSLKRLHPDPWATVAERYKIGQLVTGTITNVVDFGAFACIEEGLEGLIHVSELAEGHFLHPRNVVTEGQLVQARILSIDSQARRLGLSLRLNP